jgi:hypothetical protein
MRTATAQEAQTFQCFLKGPERFQNIGASDQEQAAFTRLTQHLQHAEIDSSIPESPHFGERISYLRPVFVKEGMRLFESLISDRNTFVTALTVMRIIKAAMMTPESWYVEEKLAKPKGMEKPAQPLVQVEKVSRPTKQESRELPQPFAVGSSLRASSPVVLLR